MDLHGNAGSNAPPTARSHQQAPEGQAANLVCRGSGGCREPAEQLNSTFPGEDFFLKP